MPYKWKKVLLLGLATAHRVFTALAKSILFLCHHKGFCINICLDDNLVLVHSVSVQVRGLTHFYVPYWFALDYILIYSSLTCASLRPFILWGYVGIVSICQYLCLLIS